MVWGFRWLDGNNSFNALLSDGAVLIGIVKIYADNVVAYFPHLVIVRTELHSCDYWRFNISIKLA